MIETHGDNSCEICKRWSGKIISLTGATKGYPTQDEAVADGLFHPRCNCYFSVVLPGEVEQLKEAA